MSETGRMYVEPGQMEAIVFGVQRLSAALLEGPYSCTSWGTIGNGTAAERGREAVSFVEQYHDITAGAFQLIAAATDILAAGIANDELSIVFKGD